MKKLEENDVLKSEIISIIGHDTEGGLDPYHSANENQQRATSNAISSQHSICCYASQSSNFEFNVFIIQPGSKAKWSYDNNIYLHIYYNSSRESLSSYQIKQEPP